jgi:UDP-N-acetylmuramate dehydrogenase
MKIMEHVPASTLSSMRCGGILAKIFEPDDLDELRGLLEGLGRFHLVGACTNTLFADTTITTPVIRLGKGFDFIEKAPGGIRAGAAAAMKKIVSRCIRDGLSGIEFMAGIPGTLGGALYMNAGTASRGIMEAVRTLEIMDGDGPRTLDAASLRFGYRSGGLPRHAIVTSAVLDLRPSTSQAVQRNVLEHLAHRRGQPSGPSSGSIFKNPERAPAGLLIDRAGLKGTRMGGAKVSEVHANFIVNEKGATTADVSALIELVKRRVRDEFGIELSEEVRIIGQ